MLPTPQRDGRTQAKLKLSVAIITLFAKNIMISQVDSKRSSVLLLVLLFSPFFRGCAWRRQPFSAHGSACRWRTKVHCKGSYLKTASYGGFLVNDYRYYPPNVMGFATEMGSSWKAIRSSSTIHLSQGKDKQGTCPYTKKFEMGRWEDQNMTLLLPLRSKQIIEVAKCLFHQWIYMISRFKLKFKCRVKSSWSSQTTIFTVSSSATGEFTFQKIWLALWSIRVKRLEGRLISGSQPLTLLSPVLGACLV
jgi:hypothetical protein